MLLDKIRAYNTWRNSGLIQSKINAMVGAPSDSLEARVGDNVLYGKAALDAIKRLPLTSEAKDAYESGTRDRHGEHHLGDRTGGVGHRDHRPATGQAEQEQEAVTTAH